MMGPSYHLESLYFHFYLNSYHTHSLMSDINLKNMNSTVERRGHYLHAQFLYIGPVDILYDDCFSNEKGSFYTVTSSTIYSKKTFYLESCRGIWQNMIPMTTVFFAYITRTMHFRIKYFIQFWRFKWSLSNP